MEVSETVVEIIAEQAILEPSDVKLDSTLAELGIDSLGLVESIFALEERFDITIPFNANQTESNDFNISTVATISAAIEQLITEQSS
jgi:acyl carrier protein